MPQPAGTIYTKCQLEMRRLTINNKKGEAILRGLLLDTANNEKTN
jgi:hypothetical protein